jgi:hypothetical protein
MENPHHIHLYGNNDMRIAGLLLIISFCLSCTHAYRYCNCETTDSTLKAYNDVLNELIEQQFYNFYLGEDEEQIFKALTQENPDTARIKQRMIQLQNHLFQDSARFAVIYLDTLMRPRFDRLPPAVIFAGDQQSIIGNLNKSQKKYAAENFTLCTAKIKAISEAATDSTQWIIGKVSLSEISFNKTHDKGLLYYEYHCGGLCGKGAMLIIEKDHNNRWHIVKTVRRWIA